MEYEIKNNRIIVDDCLDRETVDYVNTTIDVFKGHIDSIMWQGKYNRHMMFDYEPFAAQGFCLIIELKKDNVHNEFILFHLNQQLEYVKHLEKCLSIIN